MSVVRADFRPKVRRAVRDLTTRPLAADRIAQAFPVVQAALPGVTLEAWRAFAVPLTGGGRRAAQGGIMTVESEQGYISGLCAIRIENDLRHGRTLVADHFMAVDLFDRASIAEALIGTLERLAHERGCTAIHTTFAESNRAVARDRDHVLDLLAEFGHHMTTVGFCKILPLPDGRAPIPLR